MRPAPDRDGEALAGVDRVRLPRERRDETVVLQRTGSQLEDQRAHLGQGAPSELRQGREADREGVVLGACMRARCARRCVRADVIENRAWLTESCSSRARRCLSTRVAWDSAWPKSRAFSTATAAWSATACRNARSSASTSRPALTYSSRHPTHRPRAPSGTTTASSNCIPGPHRVQRRVAGILLRACAEPTDHRHVAGRGDVTDRRVHTGGRMPPRHPRGSHRAGRHRRTRTGSAGPRPPTRRRPPPRHP